ncbi:MAG: Stage II sporulation protein E [Pelotomaculum sp. PtaU1.Bin035]|nr:MAG: Stage II sporulation protein E [Pelotomaculum sp. PtaU1.Bin035]
MFENIEIYPYHRAGSGKHKHKPKAKHSFPWSKSRQVLTPMAAVCCAGFFFGRAVLLGDLVPFGVAFIAASIHVFGRYGLVSAPAVIAGLVSISRGVPLAGSVLTVACISVLIRSVPFDKKRQWLFPPGLVLVVTLIIKASLVAVANPSSYNYFGVLFEAVFAALLTMVMINGLTALKKKAGGPCLFTGEEIFCVLLVLGGLIAGAGDLKYEMVSVKGSLSRLTILLASLAGGAGTGAAAGAVVGIIPGLAYTVAPALAPAYSFAGFLAGLCRSFGKAGVATGFLFGNIILSVYVTDSGNLVAVLAETGLAILLFLLIPSSFIKELSLSVGLERGGARDVPAEGAVLAESAALEEAIAERIKNWALVFQELSHTFEQVSTTAGQGTEEQIFHKLLNQVGEKVCSGCNFYRTCWEREFYKTYQRFIDLLALVEIYGKVTRDNLSDEIKKRCSRTKELAVTVSCLYETYHVNRYWSKRLLESRGIVSEQLKGIGEVIAGLPGELKFDAETGDSWLILRKKLKEAGIKLESISVGRLGGEGVEVSLSHRPCGGRMQCGDIMEPLLSSVLEQPFNRAAAVCTAKEGDPVCQLKFCPALNYRLVLGVSGVGKGGSLVSGDSYSFFYLKGGRFGLVISDGMGVGPRAALESGITISLLRHLLELGFGQDLAIKTVNSILALRSPGESFATVDLAMVDLYSGHADFVKIGATPSYLLRGGLVSQIKASSLPVGIIEDIEVASQARMLEPGDVLVMLTDGVLEAYNGADNHEEWIIKVLEDAVDLPPREMAELLLKLAQTGAGGVARVPDDMTIVVAGLEKRR